MSEDDVEIYYVRVFEDGTEYRFGPYHTQSVPHLRHLKSLDDSGELTQTFITGSSPAAGRTVQIIGARILDPRVTTE
jgi:hypothetical protein